MCPNTLSLPGTDDIYLIFFLVLSILHFEGFFHYLLSHVIVKTPSQEKLDELGFSFKTAFGVGRGHFKPGELLGECSRCKISLTRGGVFSRWFSQNSGDDFLVKAFFAKFIFESPLTQRFESSALVNKPAGKGGVINLANLPKLSKKPVHLFLFIC